MGIEWSLKVEWSWTLNEMVLFLKKLLRSYLDFVSFKIFFFYNIRDYSRVLRVSNECGKMGQMAGCWNEVVKNL